MTGDLLPPIPALNLLLFPDGFLERPVTLLMPYLEPHPVVVNPRLL